MENKQNYFFLWVRKGISCKISEIDTLGEIVGNGIENHNLHPTVRLTTTVNLINNSQKVENKDLSKILNLAGPSDILGINASAIKLFKPSDGEVGFSNDYLPYIEFWEPDFAWRFTPASPGANGRLRPWVALVVCPKEKCRIANATQNTAKVVFDIKDNDDYQRIFPDPCMIYNGAHAQGESPNKADFCRVVAMSKIEKDKDDKDDKEYMALLIPTFEIGRLRGIGCDEEDLKNIDLQKSSWGSSFDEQNREHKNPWTFPVYKHWSFVAGKGSFETLVKKISVNREATDSIKVDVSQMGDGFDYSTLNEVPERKAIDMPTAIKTFNRVDSRYPDHTKKGEDVIVDRLKSLLTKNSVFDENGRQTVGGLIIQDKDDPWVVPPVYGAKHIMATSLDEENAEWMNQINLDLNYRAAAGLGKKAVQLHQEEFVGRAWKQLDYINELNEIIHKKELAAKLDKSLKNRTFPFLRMQKGRKKISEEKVLSRLMVKLPSMNKTKTRHKTKEGVSVSSIMGKNDIPQSFASASFRRVSSYLSKMSGNVDLQTVSDKIAELHIYKNQTPEYGLFPKKELLQSAALEIRNRLMIKKFKDKLGTFIGNKNNIFNLTVNHDKFLSGGVSYCRMERYYSFIERHTAGDYVTKSKNDDGVHLLELYLSRLIYAFKLYKQRGLNDRPIPGFTLESAEYEERFKEAWESKFYHPDMIGLRNNEYEELFGREILICRIRRREKIDDFIYVYNVDKIMEECKRNQEMADHCKLYKDYYFSLYNWSGSDTLWPGMFTNTSYYSSSMLMHGIADNYKYEPKMSNYTDMSQNKFISKDAFHLCYDGHVNMDFGYSICYSPEYYNLKKFTGWISRELEGYSALTTELNDSLWFIPDLIIIDKDYFESIGKVQYFDTINDFLDFAPNLRDIDERIASILELQDILDSMQKVEASVTRSNTNDIKELQDEMYKNEPREDNLESVKTFFEVYMNNKDLQDKYIEQLLSTKHPIMAYPMFPEPTYYYLKELSDRFVLPSIGEIPQNSISMYINNAAFIESYLCGMNTEMGKELLWREYPTDQRGSYFRKFWDTEVDKDSIINDKYFDVNPLHQWKGKLGENHLDEKGQLLQFVIRAELIKTYPSTRIYLQKSDDIYHRVISEGSVILPSSQAFLRDDIVIVGFRINLSEAIGNPPNNYGYLLVFEQEPVNNDFMFAGSAQDKNMVNDLIKVVTPVIYSKHVFAIASEIYKNALKKSN